MSVAAGTVLVAALEAMKLTEKIVEAIHKDKSEKLREKWEKDKAELAEAVAAGDLELIRSISARWADTNL